MEENVVEIYNLCKTYKNTNAVSHLHMEIKKGEIYGFIGKNGAGKSTTLKMIVGLIFPTSGEIKLFGEQRNAFTSKRIGSLIENAGLYPNLSAYDNMELKAVAMGTYNKDKIIELLNLVGLDFKNKKTVKKFSLGMKQRLGIAVALCGNPDFLVLDEPVNGLDPQGIIEIRELILKLNREHQITILISSHILDELSKLATHYGFVDRGIIVKEISAANLDAVCRKCIRLSVTDTRILCRVLDQMEIEYNIVSDTEADVYGEISVTKLALALDKENCEVKSMQEHDESLENYYMNLVGGGRNA